MSSEFGDWFDAQFPIDAGPLAKKTTDELLDMIVAGERAKAELSARQDRINSERAALYAWQAARTPQVPRKYPASAWHQGK